MVMPVDLSDHVMVALDENLEITVFPDPIEKFFRDVRDGVAKGIDVNDRTGQDILLNGGAYGDAPGELPDRFAE